MPNSLSGFQIIASQGLQNGEGISAPNIAANLAVYESFSTVKNFSNIYIASESLPYGLTSSNANLLQSIGANSFPALFGQVPANTNLNLGTGNLIEITYARTESWFGNSSTANIYLQALGQAQSYATTAQAVLSSAATSQWSSGTASASLTGGFSNIGGNDPVKFQNVANAISELGTMMIPNDPFNGFSNASCFSRILDSGDNYIGNLHLNFFGNTVIDPSNGNIWIIGSDLFSYVMDNPQGTSSDDTFQITALNPLDAAIGNVANTVLASTGDLDAVVSFFGLGSNAAAKVYYWADCFNLPALLGTEVTETITSNLGVPSLTVYNFISGLVNNIPGVTNLDSLEVLGEIMGQLSTMTNSNALSLLDSPVSSSDFSNLQSTFGNGSGSYGNPTVDDILGSTDYNDALYDTIQVINELTPSPIYGNIVADTNNVAMALNFDTFPTYLSNGNSYDDINSLTVGAFSLIEDNAANLFSQVSNVSLLGNYSNLATTHNNSISLTSNNTQCPINLTSLITDDLADYNKASELVGLVLSIIHKYYGASQILKIDNPIQPAMFEKIPGAPNFSSQSVLSSFSSSLASMASYVSQASDGDEITGLTNVKNCIDMSSLAGQALSATIKEAQNNQVLNSNGLPIKSFDSAVVSLAKS
ncbi:Uncharacterised protein [uncultured archaeon]|nr:Uncharacterised protein [uncultured archaeon]